MKLLKVFSLSSVVFLSLLLVTPTFAAVTTSASTKPAQDNSIIIATTNIYNAKIVSQKGADVDISFDVSNREGAQSGLKYSVNLVKNIKNNQTMSDVFVFPEIFNIGEHTVIRKSITYKAPDDLDGEYNVIIEIKNNSGLPLAFGDAGTIKLVATVKDVKNVEILPETCILSIEGEKNHTIYNINQGVDIAPSENLLLTCTALNDLKVETKVTPSYETHYRNLDGEIVSTTGGSITPITFKAGEKKVVMIRLPKATSPQAYMIKTALKSDNVYSNYITAYYVIQGESATIQSVSLDKDYYTTGDTAKLSLFWMSSADSFSGSRASLKGAKPLDVTLVASIKDNNQKDCVNPITQIFSDNKNGGIVTIPLPIIINCKTPQASVELKNSKGDILAQKQLSFGVKPKTELMPVNISSNKNIITIIFGVLVVAGITIYFINLKKKKDHAKHNLSK